MISKLSTHIVRVLHAKTVIAEEETELYEYGFFILLTHLIFFCFSLICGVLLGAALETALFYVAFSLIRVYAGGVHAKTEAACTGLTAFAILFSACIIRILAEQPNNVITGCMILFGAINIVAFAPLDSPEKPLDSDQKKQYSCISIVILVGLVAAAVLANLLNLHGLESVAAVSLALEGILLVSGRTQARQAKR